MESGIHLDQPTFFSWLGVTQYIDREATDATLEFIAGQPHGSEVVFDFQHYVLLEPTSLFSFGRSCKARNLRQMRE